MFCGRPSLGLALCLFLGGGGPARCANHTGGTLTTVYVGGHFEVREDDQPVKYVFNGETRVARITGSLNGDRRLQRLRLHPGWNLCALAVGEARLPAGAPIENAYRWDGGSGQYVPVDPAALLPAGTVLWIKSGAPALVTVNGTPPVPGPAMVPAAGVLAGSGALERTSLELPEGVTIWKFDAKVQRWQAALAGDLAGLREVPPFLAPGEAVFLHTTVPVPLPVVEPTRQIAYYHPDHLGSHSVGTDASGAVMRETAYHPFGSGRHQERLTDLAYHHGFTQKEQDAESRLHYFEARHQLPGLGRFASVDFLYAQPDRLTGEKWDDWLRSPQLHHPYAYALNSPLRFTDPTGLEVRKLTESELAVVLQARKEAVAMLDHAIRAVDRNRNATANDATDRAVVKWFGMKGLGNKEQISAQLTKIKKQLEGYKPEDFRFDTSGPKGALAMVPKANQDQIRFFQSFFQLTDHGLESKPGTLIHEGSHPKSSAGTRDIKYGLEDSAGLATDASSKALQNADNFEYFVESLDIDQTLDFLERNQWGDRSYQR